MTGNSLRVLCVAPRFAPLNAADSHRLRLLLPHLGRHGVEAEVLMLDPTGLTGPQDPWLSSRLPPTVPIHRAPARASSGWGRNGLTQRSFVPLYRKGNELLAQGRFDLVFFSTTEFLLHALGPLWRRRWGVPFCMDFQDPWVTDYYATRPNAPAPGGRLKFALANRLHRIVEPLVVRRCSGFLSVSSAYLPELGRRYGEAVAHQPRLVAGFPAEPTEMADALEPAEQRKLEGLQVWRYVGRGGSDMAKAASAFFQAWRMAVDRGLLRRDEVRLEAAGTSYAPDGQGAKTLEPLADSAGLAGCVVESTDRLPYRAMLVSLAASDALVVFGSDDPAYTASKIYPYLLARKPLLALFHRNSGVSALLEEVGGGTCVGFDDDTTSASLAEQILAAWFSRGSHPPFVALNEAAFAPYTAVKQAEQVAKWLRESADFATKAAP